jgi:hypothetical protein
MPEVRQAGLADADMIAGLAAELAQSFAFCRADFDLSYPALLAERNTCVLVAEQDGDCMGYLLGFSGVGRLSAEGARSGAGPVGTRS